jgi:hypothetical protein
MTIFAIGPWSGKPFRWGQGEPTLREILSDSIVQAVMNADGVDPAALEIELRSVAGAMPAAQQTGRVLACAGSRATMPQMFE